MAKISSISPKVAVVFLAEEGIAPWESIERSNDPRWMTVSVVGSRARYVIPILWTLIESRPALQRVVYRIHVSRLPEMLTRTLRRNLAAQLSLDPPGFRGTHVHWGDTHFSVLSELTDHSAVNVRSIDNYRYTALIEVEASALSPPDFSDQICRSVSAFDHYGIKWLLELDESNVVFRVLDCETHNVVQLIGLREAGRAAMQLLAGLKLCQVPDVSRLHEVIAALRA